MLSHHTLVGGRYLVYCVFLSHHTVLWGYLVYCVFFVCLNGYGFLSGGKREGHEILHPCSTTIWTGLLPFWRSKVKGSRSPGTKNAHSAAKAHPACVRMVCAHCKQQQRRTSAFLGGRGVMACSSARWGFRIMHEARRAFETGGGNVD